MHTIPSTHVRRIELEVDAVGVRDGGATTVFVSRRVTPLVRRDTVRHCSYVLALTEPAPAAVTLLQHGQARQARRDRVWLR